MQKNEIVSGRARAWSLLEKLGEGDAGEVYLVESLLEKEKAILKRPHRSAFTSDKLRQASQIESEALALRALANTEYIADCVNIPGLLDQSKVNIEQYDRFFIIVTQAQGYDLRLLARCRRSATPITQPGAAGDVQLEAFINRFAKLEQFPPLLLLRVLDRVISFLEQAHTLQFSSEEGRQYGILWNDVKPEHIYWDPSKACLTLIDWGNAMFLDEKGITLDRQHSHIDDYVQILSEMGTFLSSEAPELFAQLNWPKNFSLSETYQEAVLPLKIRLNEVIRNETAALSTFRNEESALLEMTNPSFQDFLSLDRLHDKLVSFGELPDYTRSATFTQRLAHHLLQAGEIENFQEICKRISLIPCLDQDAWKLLGEISKLTLSEDRSISALRAGLDNDWPQALWELRLAASPLPEPNWWKHIRDTIRQLHIHTTNDALTPFVALNRLVHTLRASVEGNGNTSQDIQNQASVTEEFNRELKELMVTRWTEIEPDPPGADLSYKEVDPYLSRLEKISQGAGNTLEVSLNQPRAQVQIILDSWERQDFEIARRGLRTLLVWDPDRMRVISADEAVQAAPLWLREVGKGPMNESRLDFVTRMELRGRSLRQKVGPATWLDAILDALKSLRKGNEPADIMLQHPELRDLTGWLLELEPSRPLLVSSDREVTLVRKLTASPTLKLISGRSETTLGEDGDMLLGEALDVWAPEARGSSARVFQGFLRDQDETMQKVAIKLMRPGRADYALPLFEEEVHVLDELKDTVGVTPLLECGFVRLEPGKSLPLEDRAIPAYELDGDVRRFGQDVTRHFLTELPQRTANGWLPYLALDKRDPADNLLFRCDASYTRGNLLPMLDGLAIAIQILDILAEAHAHNIVYRDHKILHYYWLADLNGVSMIDWNIAKLYRSGIPNGEIQFDLVQFSARALHHILTGRPAPGALPLGPNRPEEIEAASRSYNVQWTYDDQRLPQSLKAILERSLAGEYQTADALREELHEIFQKLSVLLQVQ